MSVNVLDSITVEDIYVSLVQNRSIKNDAVKMMMFKNFELEQSIRYV